MKSIKNIFYVILIFILYVGISSYTTTNNSEKKVMPKDSISVNVNVKSQSPKIDVDLYKDLRVLLKSTIDLNNSKQQAIDKFMSLSPGESVPLLDQLCIERGYTKEILFKKARADTSIKFWSSLIFLFIIIFTVYIFVTQSIKRGVEWKSTLIFSLLILSALIILNTHFQYIMSYIFNNEYLTMKELIKFF